MGQSPSNRYAIAFYNLENLFDTINDPATMDEEFTPEGSKQWTTARYRRKLDGIDRVIFEMSAATKGYPCVIGLSEMENRHVLTDLVAMPRIKKAGYQIVHYDSPEARGVDVALLYRPDVFRYEGSYPITTAVQSLPGFKTRDILAVWGSIGNDRFCFFVCQWPSRRGGKESSEFKRVGAAECVRHAADSIMRLRPDVKIVIMGDMSDNPSDVSLAKTIGASNNAASVRPRGFYNPFWEMYKKGVGSVIYGEEWNMFDNIIVNCELLKPAAGSLGLAKSEKNGFAGNVFSRPFMWQQTETSKSAPWRTYSGNTYLGGYSDHLPVYIIISK